MVIADTLRGRKDRWVWTQLLVILLCWPASSALAQASQLEPSEDEAPVGERVVHSAAAFKKDPLAKGMSVDQLGPERIDPAIPRPVQLDDSGCQLLPLALEALEPASQRAVVRLLGKPPRVVKPGSTILATVDENTVDNTVSAENTVVVRLVREDLLVADGPAGEDGKRPVLWIHPPEAPGAKSRVQCFVPGTVSQ